MFWYTDHQDAHLPAYRENYVWERLIFREKQTLGKGEFLRSDVSFKSDKGMASV